MRGRHSHIELFTAVAMLVVSLLFCVSTATAQTAPGTPIVNEAKGSFRYRSGLKDSVRSNRTETVVQPLRTVASSMQISIVPEAIVGNGIDTASVTVFVRDASGNPVPDGVRVTLVTSPGAFPGGKDTAALSTVNGTISVPVTSALVSQQIVTARVTATTAGVNNLELSASATVLFFPGAVFGSVTSAFTGRPVSTALVVASDGSEAEAGRDTTGPDGKYLIPLSKPGMYTHTITCQNRFGDRVQMLFHEELAIPAHGGIPPTGALNAVSGNIIDQGTSIPVRRAGIRVALVQSGAPTLLGAGGVPIYRTTDERGVFQFDSLSPGSYEIHVSDPQYAGSVTVHDTLGSCFLIDVGLGVSSDNPAFEVVKSANKRIAEIGDAVAYVLDVRNTSATVPLTNIRILDDLPLGFAYVAGSSRHERSEVADPSGYRKLEWVLADTLLPGKSTRLSYMTTIGSAALDGDGVNRAYGLALGPTGDTVKAPVSAVAVVVRPGIFTDHGIVIGKIFFEENENGSQEFSEAGIAGVELWMEDGTHIITGNDGKFSLPDVKPGQHVIRVDQRTLPAGSTLLPDGTESAGSGATRFIRLVEGGVARADFHVRPPRQASLELSVAPFTPSGRLRASFVVRCATKHLPSTIVLIDTLPKGLLYDMHSLTLNGSSIAGTRGLSRSLRLELPVRPLESLDTVSVALVSDSSYTKRVGVMRPTLVLSYPQRRDAVFRTVETFSVPANGSFGSLTREGAKKTAVSATAEQRKKGSD